MIETQSDLTAVFSVPIGLFMMATGLGAVISSARLLAVFDDLERSPMLSILAGGMALALGAAIIASHSYWDDPLGVIISLIGWAAAIKGLVLIAAPGLLTGLARPVLRNSSAAHLGAVAILLAGVALTVAGLIARHETY
jgi:hypothetical protein